MRSITALSAGTALAALALGCGARSSLPVDEGAGGTGGDGGAPPVPCRLDVVEVCGTDVGACATGLRQCEDGVFGPCEGAVGPVEEACNDIDDDCDGSVDEDFHIGETCDGADNDACLDDVMSCAGCSLGPDIVEICNGVDDNCNGVVDADCEVGDCEPTLLVTGSTPSSEGCIDFPVTAGSTGVIVYPCEGGPVTAELGTVSFTGSVVDGFVSLDGTAIIPAWQSPDGCTWETTHHIEGPIAGGVLSYWYSEAVLGGPGVNCWQPCTETGTVAIQWVIRR